MHFKSLIFFGGGVSLHFPENKGGSDPSVTNVTALYYFAEEAVSRSRRSPLVLSGDPRSLVVHLAGEIIGELVGEKYTGCLKVLLEYLSGKLQ